MLISVDETGKNHLGPGRNSIVTNSWLKDPWSKAAGILEHCREEETNC
jgi:hypothetical protein